MDFYDKLRPGASQHQLVWIGRVATTVMVVIGLLWIPVIRGGKGLYDYLQGVQGYLAPPIFVVFFLGVFMKRLNGKGCLAALIVGFALGAFRLAVDTPVKLFKDRGFAYTEGSFFWVVNNIYFQYYSVLIFLTCIVVMILVSYATAAPSDDKIRGLTFATTTREHRALSRTSWNRWDLAASGMVLQVILAAYGYFSSVRSGETLIGLAPYPLAWIGILIAAALLQTSPQRRAAAGPLVAGVFGSVVGFVVAFVATRFVLRGLVALIAAPLLHGSLSDGYNYSVVFVIGFIGSLLACPVAAIVGFAQGYESLAKRRLAAAPA
jgi:uncharacterized sodium:solute symporter family permease YidK